MSDPDAVPLSSSTGAPPTGKTYYMSEWESGPAEVRQVLAELTAARARIAELLKERDEARRNTLIVTCRGLLAEARAYNKKWSGTPGSSTWDDGFAQGVEAAAHSVANSIDRPTIWDQYL